MLSALALLCLSGQTSAKAWNEPGGSFVAKEIKAMSGTRLEVRTTEGRRTRIRFYGLRPSTSPSIEKWGLQTTQEWAATVLREAQDLTFYVEAADTRDGTLAVFALVTTFTGDLAAREMNEFDYALSLLGQGLAKLEPTEAEKLSPWKKRAYRYAEASARDQKIGMWARGR